MEKLPHVYTVSTRGNASDIGLVCEADNLPTLSIAGPPEFDGPGDQWSPETLLCAALANCFVLSFKAIATASRFEWVSLQCDVEGELAKVERSLQFTRFHQQVVLEIGDETQREKAEKLLEKAEVSCLIGNSLKAAITLDYRIAVNPL